MTEEMATGKPDPWLEEAVKKYEREDSRAQALDSKAPALFHFGEVVIAALIGFYAVLLKALGGVSIYFQTFFFSSLGLLLVASFLSLQVSMIYDYEEPTLTSGKDPPQTEVDAFSNRKLPDAENFNERLTKSYINCWLKNYTQNQRRADSLNKAGALMRIGIAVAILAMLVLAMGR